MKHELGDKARLEHILEAIQHIDSFLGEMDFTHFSVSVLHRSAVERQLEIIGEATAHISDGLKLQYPEVDWRPIKRFRNVIVHEYFGVSIQLLWGVIQKELPVLKIQIFRILNNIQE